VTKPLPASRPENKSDVNPEIVSTLPKPRLNFRRIADSQKAITLNHILRNSPCTPDTVFHINRLYETSLSLRRKLDSVRAKQRDVGNLIKAGGGDEAVRQAKKLKLKVVEYEKILEETEKELLELGLTLPNETHPATPVGKEKEAIELERFGPSPISADKRRDHLDISSKWNWVDTAASATATGTSWPYFKGSLALLEQALIQYALSVAVQKGWTPVATPDVVKEDVMARCGFQPRDAAGQTYYLTTTPPNADPAEAHASQKHANLVLTATAEIPLAALSADKIIAFQSLPQKFVGVGKAFRAEAGARGADTRGLYRLHQFQKIELFAVTEGALPVSEAMMEEMREMQKEIYSSLGLSVR
jgi:seryl-tRNA synthetase